MTNPIATRLVNGERVPAWHLAPPRARQSVINQRGLSVIQKIRDIHTEQASLARELGQKPPTRAIVGISVFAGLLAVLALATIAADPAASGRPHATGTTTPASVEAAAGDTGERL